MAEQEVTNTTEQGSADSWAQFRVNAEATPESDGTQIKGGDEWSTFRAEESSPSEKIAAVGQGATGAFLETAPILGGMAMGASIGTTGGPFAPVTVPLGAAIGGYAGYKAGQEARNQAEEMNIPFTDAPVTRSVEDMPDDVRPFGFAGEVIGGSAPFAAVPLAAAKTGSRLPPSMVGNFINRILNMAERAPGTFALAEAAGAGGSAVASGVAESYAPGRPGVRVSAEIAGGFFNPSRLIVGASRGVMDTGRLALQSMTQAGRETRAGKILTEVVQQAGEDPELLAKMLQSSGLPGVNPTSAQKTGSPALIALETKLRGESAKFSAEAGKRAEESLLALENMTTALRGTGDPQALKAAAELRSRYFKTLLAGRLQSAERETIEVAQGISTDTPDVRAALSVKARGAIETAMKDARSAESELWEVVPKDIIGTADTLISRFAKIRSSLLPEEPLPAIAEGFVKRMTDGNGATTSGELIQVRSRMLALSREAMGQGKANDARIYGQLAEAALDDLDNLASGADRLAPGVLGYDDARAFSRALNETFTQTFAGKAIGSTARGGARVPPEIVLRRALAAGKEMGDLQLLELEEATRFLSRMGLDSPEAAANVDTMLDAQERMIRLAAADAVNPNTGRASAPRLGKFTRDNKAILDRFPEVRADLESAISSETGLKNLERMAVSAERAISQRAAFSKLLKVETPDAAISKAVSGPKPIADLRAIIKTAKRGNAQGGLRAAIFDYALSKSRNSAGEFSFNTLHSKLFEPIGSGQPSLMDLMVKNGIVDSPEPALKIINEAEKIVSALLGTHPIDELMSAPDGLLDTAMRIAGARAGAAVSSTGSSLIAASAGSRYVRAVLGRIPQGRVTDVLIEAAKDPDFAAMLLKKPQSQSEGIKLARQIHAYILQAGLLDDDDNQNR